MPAPDTGGCVATREILDRIGDKWSLYIVAVLANGPRRFNELKRSIDGISQRMLTLTLRGLERDGARWTDHANDVSDHSSTRRLRTH